MLINNSSQASINTKAQTRTDTGANPSLTQLFRNDSSSVVVMDEPMLDPLSGGAIMHQLKNTFHTNAIQQIDQSIGETERIRSRHRRRREMAGPKEVPI